MKIIVAGATGFIGKPLVKALQAKGHQVAVLSRPQSNASRQFVGAQVVSWQPGLEDAVVKEIDGSDAVINLAGEPIVGKRWSVKQKQILLESRVNATHCIARSIQRAAKKPSVLINASAIGYYGSRGNEELLENSRPGEGFIADVCKAWEAHAIRVQDFNVRVVMLRIGIVLDKSGGALQKMLLPFRMFAGGWLGPGHQWMSWIHRQDMVNLIVFCLENSNAKGPVNCVSPQPVTNKVFSMVLAQTLSRPCFMPVPELALKLLMGEMSIILLASQRVLPDQARRLEFKFQYSDLRTALQSILR